MLLAMELTVFHTKEIWFYIFGTAVVIYILVSIYNRIKRPKKGIRKIEAKVENIIKIRVQTTHRNAGFDGLMSGGAAIPGARFEVTFSTEKSNDSLIFAINEKNCDELKIGDRGILCYNGDEFISFGPQSDGDFKNTFAKIGYKRIIFAVLALFIVFLIWMGVQWGRNSNTPEEVITIEEVDENVLKVYMSGNPTNGDEFYSTRYKLGEFNDLTEKWGEEAHIFYDAVHAYQKNTDQEIEITFFKTTSSMLETACEEWKAGGGPDVIIGDYTQNEYSLYPYIEQGMFYDLIPFFEKDEIYSSNQYVSEILEGGLINNEQLVFPLTFNMNVLFTSEERMKKHEVWLSDDMQYEDMLDLFSTKWREKSDENEYLMAQFTNQYNNYPYILFQTASGENVIDYETGKIRLTYESFSEWAILYESYIYNEYKMTTEELKELKAQQPDIWLPEEESSYAALKALCKGEASLDMFGLMQEHIVCYAEGGSNSAFLHSFAANARYYESRFTDMEEDFVCMGVPVKGSADGYAAQITTFGVVVSGSQKAEEGYEFIKMLADSEHWFQFDLSVNRQMLEETMEILSNSYYEFYTTIGLASAPEESEPEVVNTEADDYDDVKWYGESYQMKPMSEETKEYLLYMVDHIEAANLPEYGLIIIITQEIEEYLWGDTNTIEEAYEKAINRLVEMGYLE